MAAKRVILYILLALGILMIGSGVWLLHNATQEKVNILEGNPVIKVNIPEGNPVIYEKLDYAMRGEYSYLYIYEEGSILLVEEKGLRMPFLGNTPTRTWKTGKLTPEQLNSLLEYFKDSGLDNLEEYYQSPEKPVEGGGFIMGDMGFTITVNSEKISKTVTAFGYLTPDNGETYPDMPSPLNEIYGRLRTLTMTTEKVYQENISP